MERSIKNVTGQDIIIAYNNLYGEFNNATQSDINHFTKQFQRWVEEVRINIQSKKPCDLSLNKKNYLGKKTRALLKAINKKEPKTLTLLVSEFREEIS